jgi:hypothetical protein
MAKVQTRGCTIANLYRLESIVEDMEDSVSVRARMNEFVRGVERSMKEKVRILSDRLK